MKKLIIATIAAMTIATAANAAYDYSREDCMDEFFSEYAGNATSTHELARLMLAVEESVVADKIEECMITDYDRKTYDEEGIRFLVGISQGYLMTMFQESLDVENVHYDMTVSEMAVEKKKARN